METEGKDKAREGESRWRERSHMVALAEMELWAGSALVAQPGFFQGYQSACARGRGVRNRRQHN